MFCPKSRIRFYLIDSSILFNYLQYAIGKKKWNILSINNETLEITAKRKILFVITHKIYCEINSSEVNSCSLQIKPSIFILSNILSLGQSSRMVIYLFDCIDEHIKFAEDSIAMNKIFKIKNKNFKINNSYLYIQMHQVKSDRCDFSDITLHNKYKIQILDDQNNPKREFEIKGFNILEYYNMNFKKNWESKGENITNKKIYLKYYIDFIRFEYARRNAEYVQQWNKFASLRGVVINDAEQAVIVYSKYLKDNILLAKSISNDWGIDYPYSPLNPLPEDYKNIFIYEQVILGFKVSVIEKNLNKIIKEWKWNIVYSINPHLKELYCIDKYFHISYSSDVLNPYSYNITMLDSDNNDFFVREMNDYILNYKKKPTELIFTKYEQNSLVQVSLCISILIFGSLENLFDIPNYIYFFIIIWVCFLFLLVFKCKIPLKLLRYKIISSIFYNPKMKLDLMPYHDDPYEISVLPLVYFKVNKKNGFRSDIVNCIDSKKSFNEFVSKNWDIFAINKNAGINIIKEELSKIFYELHPNEKRPPGFDLLDHIRSLIAWDMRQLGKTEQEIADDIGPRTENGKPTNPKSIQDAIKRAEKNIFDKKYKEII